MDILKNLICDPINRFDQIAQYLFKNTLLSINGTYFQIYELEFYLYNEKHKDIFTHKFEEQLTNFKWYFHKSSPKEYAYKSGTFKGLDLTCGSNTMDNKSYGGILIRSIKNMVTSEIIQGPCCVVNKILELTNCITIKQLVCDEMKNNINADSPILNLTIADNNIQHVFQTPRIGLTLKKKDNLEDRQYYIGQLYRYILEPWKITKGKAMAYPIAMNKGYILPQFGNDKQCANILYLIETLKNNPFSMIDYVDKNLTDNHRLQLYFSLVVDKLVKPKIKIKLKNQSNDQPNM